MTTRSVAQPEIDTHAAQMAPAIQIDPEFRDLIPPLTPEEHRQLEENLRRDGCRDPLVVWQGVLLDGHNRRDICEAHALPYQTVEQPCADREAAKAWIIRHQLGRRNLQAYQRGELALQLEALLAAEARQRMSDGGKGIENSRHLPKTDVALGEIAGLSDHTLRRVKVLHQQAPEEVKVALRAGKTSINRAYTDLARTSKTRTPTSSKAKATAAAPRSVDARVRQLQQQLDAVHQEWTARTRALLQHIEAGRKDARDGYNGWRQDNVHTLKQSKLLDWVVDELREVARLSEDGPRFAVVAHPLTVEMFKAALHLEIQARRQEARDGYHKWRPDNVHTQKQSHLLDWIEDYLAGAIAVQTAQQAGQ